MSQEALDNSDLNEPSAKEMGLAASSPSLKLNALSNSMVMVLGAAITFFLTPAMLDQLGERRFGMWTLVSSLVGYFSLLQFGLTSSVFYYVPLFRGRGEKERVGLVISTAFTFYLGLGLVILLVLFASAGSISTFFRGDAELTALIQIVGLAFALELPTLILSSAIRGYEGFVPTNLVTGLGLLIRGVLLFICLWLGYGLVAMGWVLVLVRVVSIVGFWMVFRRVCTGVSLHLSAFSWAELKTLLIFGGVIVIASTSNALAVEAPKQIVGKVVSVEALALFAVPLMLVSYYRQLIFTLTRILAPRISYFSGQNRMPEIRSLFLRSSRYISILATSMAVIGCILGPAFLPIWTRHEQMRQAVPVLLLLLVSNGVLLSNRVTSDLLLGLGRQGVLAFFELIEAVAIVVLVIVLSMHHGILGAAWGMAVPFVIVRGLLQPYWVCRLVGTTFRHYCRECFLSNWTLAAAVSALAWLTGAASWATNWITFAPLTALVLLVYGILAFLFIARPDEREQLQSALGRHLPLVGWFFRLASGRRSDSNMKPKIP